MLEKYTTTNRKPEQVIDALKEADHFYICHYSKKRQNRTPQMFLGRQV